MLTLTQKQRLAAATMAELDKAFRALPDRPGLDELAKARARREVERRIARAHDRLRKPGGGRA